MSRIGSSSPTTTTRMGQLNTSPAERDRSSSHTGNGSARERNSISGRRDSIDTAGGAPVDVAPLMNEYKWVFFGKRFAETAFGGLKLKTGKCLPAHIYISQILVFIVPAAVGIAFTLAAEFTTAQTGTGMIMPTLVPFAVVSLAVLLFQLVLFIVNYVRKRNESRAMGGSAVPINEAFQLDDEEDLEPEDFKCCNETTLGFIFPSKQSLLTIFLHALLSGVLTAGAVWYLTPRRLRDSYDSTAFSWIYFSYGWIVYPFVIYSLSAHPPPEMNTYRPDDVLGLSAYTRPFYFFLPIVIDFIAYFTSPSWLDIVNKVFRIGFLCFPVLWLVGTLPQVDVLFFWLTEQILVSCLGGTHGATNLRVFAMGMLALIAALAVFIINYFTSTLVAVLCSVPMGFLLSQDLLIIGTKIMGLARWKKSKLKHIKIYSGEEGATHTELNTQQQAQLERSDSSSNVGTTTTSEGRHQPKEDDDGQKGSPRVAQRIFTPSNIATAVLLTAFVAVGFGVSFPAHFKLSEIKYSRSLEGLKIYLEVASVVCCTVFGALTQIQRVYCWNLFKNPLFFKQQHRASAVSSLLYGITEHVLAFHLLVYLVLFMNQHYSMNNYIQSNALAHRGIIFLESVFILRAFRWIWQSTYQAGIEVVVVMITNRIFPYIFGQSYNDMFLATKLFVAGFIISRAHTFVYQLKFALVSIVSSMTNKKLRYPGHKFVSIAQILLFPVLLLLVMLACTFLSAPLLPLLGIPVFLIGFPRCMRAWPTSGASYSSCGDTIYYAQMLPHIVNEGLPKLFASGALGDIRPGEFYLLRYDSFFVWIEILEKGYNYVNVNIKGLELQTTSCHSLEATRIDEVIDSAFDEHGQQGLRKCYGVNPHFFHSLEPMTKCHITGYSISNVQMTGIIDNPANLRAFPAIFVKCVVWILLHHSSRHAVKNATQENHHHNQQQQQQQQQASLLPSSLLDDNSNTNKYQSGFSRFERRNFINNSENNGTADNEEAFPAAWYNFLKEHMSAQSTSRKTNNNSNNEQVHHDAESERQFKRLVLSFYTALMGSGFGFSLRSGSGGPYQLFLLFHGSMSQIVDENPWLQESEFHRRVFVRAVRYAFKAMYDQAVLYAGSDLENDDLKDMLSDFDENWFIGDGASGSGWDANAMRDKPNLFTLEQRDKNDTLSFQGKWLKLDQLEFKVCKMNGEAIRGLWASLNLELFYFTNDDDERYSIQAHTLLMRNITIHAAEPPLGYPIFASGPVTVRVRK